MVLQIWIGQRVWDLVNLCRGGGGGSGAPVIVLLPQQKSFFKITEDVLALWRVQGAHRPLCRPLYTSELLRPIIATHFCFSDWTGLRLQSTLVLRRGEACRGVCGLPAHAGHAHASMTL